MPVTATTIANLALAHCAAPPIAHLDTDQSKEAKACRLYYEPVRDEVLRAFAWPFAGTFEALTLVATQPTTEWAFSYRYPSKALTLLRIVPALPTVPSPYRIGRDATGRVIYCNDENAVAEYTYGVTDASEFTPDFVSALGYRLASEIAPLVTAGDQFNLGAKAYQLYQVALNGARLRALQEQQLAPEADGGYLGAR